MTPTALGPSPCESEDGGYGSLNAESSLGTTCKRKCHNFNLAKSLNPATNIFHTHTHTLLTSASLGLLARSSCVGEWGLLAAAAAPLGESSRPLLGSSRGLLVASGSTSSISAAETELLGGGEAGFALTAGSAEKKKTEKLDQDDMFVFLTSI